MASTQLTPIARFDDALSGDVLQFSTARTIVRADEPEQVRPALRAVQAAVDEGAWAAGMVAYEAAAALLPGAATHPPVPGLPLVWFALCDAPDEDPPSLEEARALRGGHRTAPWRMDWSAADHARRIRAVHHAIGEGDSYQVNLTTRLRGTMTGDLLGAHLELAAQQRAAHSGYLDLGRHAVLSASPELHVERRGDLLTARPMKGTAARGPAPASDAQARADLLSSEKERAENVMIVDLLRNDLARIVRSGSVAVPQLLRAEDYPTLWQMTSTITAQALPDTGLEDLLEASFPCGSVTGAPKLSTMELIQQLEDSPRGVYCGAVGWMSPASSPQGAMTRLNVAIRTVLVDREDDSAVYGVGSGITWGSEAAPEFQELRTKSRVLDVLRPTDDATPPADAGQGAPGEQLQDFALLETLAVDRGRPRHLEEHLDRLLRSAADLRITADRDRLRDALMHAAAQEEAESTSGSSLRLLRLALALDGTWSLSCRTVPAGAAAPLRLAVSDERVDPGAPAVRHKTTDRAHLDVALAAARAADPDVDDVILRGRAGYVTETTIASLAARIDGIWWTPPLQDGCLPGIGRRLAIEAGRLRERSLTADQLRGAEALAVISSARGWRAASLAEPPAEP